MATATTWGPWIKNGASAAWRLPINSVVDLNNITEGGWFQGLLGPTNANLPAPAGTYFYLQVMNFAGSPGNCTQVAYEYTGGNYPRKFTRGNYAGTWTPWQEIALTNSPAFTGTPTAPTASPGANTTQLANTAFVKAAVDAAPMLGVGQTWQDVTGSRASGTIYTNTTGRPISFAVSGLTNSSGLGVSVVTVDGVIVSRGNTSSQSVAVSYNSSTGMFTVPAGKTYSSTFVFSSGFIWSELR